MSASRLPIGSRVVESLHAHDATRRILVVTDETYKGMANGYVLVRPQEGGAVELFHQRDLERTGLAA